MDILLRFDSAQRQGENKTAQLWAAGEQRPRASGPCPPRPESRSPAWPGPCARGPRGSFSPSAGGRSGSGPAGRRKPQRASARLAGQAGLAGPSPPRRSQPQRRGAQSRGLDTARPAAPEEAAAQGDGAELKRKTGRRGLQAPTMEGTTEEAPTPSCFPFSRSLSARPRPAGYRRRSPAPQEPYRRKMAAPRLPPLPPAAGSDATAAWSSANQRGRS